MSFTINFYHMRDPKNKINKSLSSVYSITGTMRNETDIVNPTILVESNIPINGNYAYIELFNRYYFVTEMRQVRTGLWEIHLHTDVLKSFSEGILNSPCIVARSHDRFNLYLNDELYKSDARALNFTRIFPHGFDTDNMRYILAVLGDSTSTPPTS